MPRPPERGGEITDEMTTLWREGCALLDQMTKREFGKGESELITSSGPSTKS
jgi:hypothetical protein